MLRFFVSLNLCQQKTLAIKALLLTVFVPTVCWTNTKKQAK